jgi:hypothetical protein
LPAPACCRRSPAWAGTTKTRSHNCCAKAQTGFATARTPSVRNCQRICRRTSWDIGNSFCGPSGRHRREWTGDGKRPWTGRKTRRRWAVPDEVGSRQCESA